MRNNNDARTFEQDFARGVPHRGGGRDAVVLLKLDPRANAVPQRHKLRRLDRLRLQIVIADPRAQSQRLDDVLASSVDAAATRFLILQLQLVSIRAEAEG